MQKPHNAAVSGTLAGWGTSLPVRVVGLSTWTSTCSISVGRTRSRVHVFIRKYHIRLGCIVLTTLVHSYTVKVIIMLHTIAQHNPVSCGCQPLGRCWRSCQAAHMYIYHVLRHIDNLVGPPPPPVLVPAGDHEEDHGKYVDTTGVGSSEVQDRCE